MSNAARSNAEIIDALRFVQQHGSGALNLEQLATDAADRIEGQAIRIHDLEMAVAEAQTGRGVTD